MAPFYPAQFLRRFWSKVQKSDQCWLWIGSRLRNGYGQIHLSMPGAPRGPDGRSGRRMLLAHRLSWEISRGPIPDRIEVCHNCPDGDNPLCVNPDHLFLGSHADNMIDAGKKLQMPHGNRHPHSRLTEKSVRQLRLRYAVGDTTLQSLADEFGISVVTIYDAISRKTWKHVR